MKIARYLRKPSDPECTDLVVRISLTEQEHAVLDNKSTCYAWLENGQIRISSGTKYPIIMGNEPNKYIRINIEHSFFPGTKVFGFETVDVGSDGPVLIASMPLMLAPVKPCNRGKTKSTKYAEIDTGLLVRELNLRRVKDKRLQFRVDNDGLIHASMEF